MNPEQLRFDPFRPLGPDCGPKPDYEKQAKDFVNRAVSWSSTEPDEIIAEFTKLLRGPTGDGANKRQAGEKVSWKVDPGHVRGIFSHLGRWCDGEDVDPDSGCHPLVHAAWRCLAQAWQETHGAT